MKKPLAPPIALLFLFLSACATTYRPLGFGGGYSDVQIDANTYRVSFRGNGYTSRDRVETYMLYRCAELTDQAGYDYFVVVNTGTDARQSFVTTPGTYSSTTVGTATAYGNTAYGSATTTGTYTPGQTMVATRYGGTAIIKLFKGDKPSENPNAFVAREVLKYLGPNVPK